MRRFLRCVWYVLAPFALYFFVVGLATRCASAPPSPDRPMVACAYDNHQRFRPALIVDRGETVTQWVLRIDGTAAPYRLDPDVRISASVSVRPGYCPHEMAVMMGRTLSPPPR